jgi:hypothetical protein
MFDNSVGARSVGVGIPAGQLSPGTGQPRTVRGFMELRNIAIEYVDDAGNVHRTIAMVDSNGTWYLPPNGENFQATLRGLAEGTWLAKALKEELARRDADSGKAGPVAPIPAEDAVDVVK